MSLVILKIQTRVAVFLSPPHGFHPRPLQQAVCVDKAEEHQCRREHSTNVLPSSFFAILRPTTGEKMDMPLGNQERSLSYTLFINRNRQQQQRLMQRGPTAQTGSEEMFTGLT